MRDDRADYSQDRRYRVLVLLAAFASLRWGEVTALRRCDLDLAAGAVRVRAAFTERSTGEIILGPPKSRAGRRMVSGGYSQIAFIGSSSWSGECIGDAYNNSNDADVSLDPCGSASGGQGWGTNMTWGTSGCPSGEAWFYDAHWKGYLGPPAGAVNGSHFYLNKPSPVCFSVTLES